MLSADAQQIKEEIELNGGSFLPPITPREPREKLKEPDPSPRVRLVFPDKDKTLVEDSKDIALINKTALAVEKSYTLEAIKRFVARVEEGYEVSLDKYVSLQKRFLAKSLIEALIGPLEVLVSNPEAISERIKDFVNACKIKKPELIIDLIKQCLPRENAAGDTRTNHQNNGASFAPIIINNHVAESQTLPLRANNIINEVR